MLKFLKKDLSILLFRTDKIGDVVLALPVLECIKKSYPASKITFVASSYTKALFLNNPNVDDLICVDEISIRGIFANWIPTMACCVSGFDTFVSPRQHNGCAPNSI